MFKWATIRVEGGIKPAYLAAGSARTFRSDKTNCKTPVLESVRVASKWEKEPRVTFTGRDGSFTWTRAKTDQIDLRIRCNAWQEM